MPSRPAHRRLIVADIIEKINNKTYRPGQQLPFDHEIAAQFHCSVSPVKAAMDELSIRGYVDRQQGKGTFVAAHPPGVSPD